MRKIILSDFITLDGVMQAPDGPDRPKDDGTPSDFKYGGWTVPYFGGLDEAAGEFIAKYRTKPFDLLLGRRTYDIFAPFWPDHEALWPGVNGATKYVVSDKPMELTWQNSELVTGDDVVEQIKKLKESDGPDLQVHGSGNLTQTLLKHDMVDEMWLKIFPLTLGTGLRLLGEGTIPAAFKLTDSLITPNGIVFLNYQRDGDVKTATMGAQA
jgi:dihydrofolate reductase